MEILAGVLVPLGIQLTLFWFYPALCLWRIAGKTRTNGRWMAWLPGVNLVLVCRIGGESEWWAAGALIPFAGVVVVLALLVQVPKALGIDGAGRYLMVVPVFNFAYLGYLAFRPESRELTARPVHA